MTKDEQLEFITQLEPEAIEALVEAMFLAADADGEVSPDEESELCRSISAVSSGEIDEARARAAMARARLALAESTRSRRLQFIGSAIPKLRRRNALALAAQVTIVDDVITGDEEDLLVELGGALGMERAEALEVVRAVMEMA